MEQGPPPGGYGLHPTPREPETEKAPDAPAMSPFRTAPGQAALTPVRSKGWLGIPILGIALISVRMLLLCSRNTAPSYGSPDLFTPLALPTTFAPPSLSSTLLGPATLAADGTAYFVTNHDIYSQPKDAESPMWMFTGSGAIRAVATAADTVYAIDGVGLRRISSTGAAETVTVGNFTAMTIDGSHAYVLLPSAIQKVTLANGSLETIASVDPKGEENLTGPLVSSQGWLWFGQGAELGRIAKKSEFQMIGKPFAPLPMLSVRAAPGGVLVGTIAGVSEIVSGKVRTLTPEDWDTACHDAVAAGKYVYFTYRDESGWAVGRMKREGGAVAPVVHAVIQPQLAVGKGGTVVWTTPDGVQDMPELH
jgi:hypothetical protein